MKKFTFKVTRVENYEAKIEIEAESEQKESIIDTWVIF